MEALIGMDFANLDWQKTARSGLSPIHPAAKNRRFAVLACPPQRLRQPPIALLSDSRHSDFCHSVYDINGFFLPTASDPD